MSYILFSIPIVVVCVSVCVCLVVVGVAAVSDGQAVALDVVVC